MAIELLRILMVSNILGHMLVCGRPNGAPQRACEGGTNIIPYHEPNPPSTSAVPYSVNLSRIPTTGYIPGKNYKIKLQGSPTNKIFRGFMIQGRLCVDDSPVGKFSSGVDYKPQCSGNTAATHTRRNQKRTVNLVWTAPPAGTGCTCFRYAFVSSYSLYWANLTTICINEDPQTTVGFNQSEYSVVEDDGLVTVVLVLSDPLSTDFTVLVKDTNGSATGGSDDYNSGPYIVTFLAGVTHVLFNVTITDDNVLEDDESFFLTIDSSSLPSNVTVNNVSQATVTVLDNDAIAVMFGQSRYSVNERDEPAQAVLVLSNPSSTDFTVQVTTTDDSATGAGVDYASGPYNITLPARVTTVPFKVSLTDDHIMEQDENFILNITQSLLPDGVTIGDPGVTVVTIVDNDPIDVMFNQSVYTVDENGGPAQLALVLSNPSSTVVTVQVTTTDRSANGVGVDYDSGPYAVIFPAGITSVPFNIPITDDRILESNENFNLSIDISSLPNDVNAGSPQQATVTIAEDDYITVMFSQSVYSVKENAGVATPLLVLSNPSSTDIIVQVRDTENRATRNSDYGAGPYNVTFLAGETIVTFDIPIISDSILEGNEDFNLLIVQSSLPNRIIRGIPRLVTVTIVDDDAVTVFFNQSVYSFDEGESAQLGIILSNPSLNDISVLILSTDASAAGGVDYDLGPYTVTFTAGIIHTSFNFSLIDDDVFENSENFVLTIHPSSLPNNVTVGDPGQVTVTIVDNDAPTVSFGESTYNVDEYDGPALLAVVLSNPLSIDILIKVLTVDGSATGGDTYYGSGLAIVPTSAEGEDYTSGPYNVMISAGGTVALLTIAINDDNTFEGNENFTLVIDSSSLPSDVTIIHPGWTTLTIIEDDAVTVFFDRLSYRVNENRGPAQPALVLSNPSSTYITVHVIDNSSSAIGAGVDYDSGPYVVTFPAGVTHASFDVPITNDIMLEGDENFNLIIESLSLLTGVSVSNPAQITVTIVDDDDTILRFNQTVYRVNEDDGIVHPVLVLSNPTSHDVTIQVNDDEITATRDSDYTSGLYNITIFAGQIAVSFDIPITSDNLLEGNETFRLFIIPKSLPYLFSRGNPATAVVMIINNEVTTVNFEQRAYSVNEFDGSIQPILIFSKSSSYDIRVQVLADGGGNYTIGQYNITLPIGATRVSLYVPINNDNTVEVNEKFDLVIDQFSLPTNVNAGSVYKATVSIMDDDDGCSVRRHEYYMGFFYNDAGGNRDLSVVLTTTELQPVTYYIHIPRTGNRYSGIIVANGSVVVHLPSSMQVSSYSHRDYGIYLETGSDKVTVIGRSYTSHTTDTYLALPIIKLKTVTEYTYYAMSFYSPGYYSSILIVGAEDNTVLRLKFKLSSRRVYMYNTRYYIYSYREYSYTINRLQTFYIYPYSSSDDLSGTRIITNKPVSVFSGHRCSYVPYRYGSCGYLIEQIPPTVYLGKVHYVAPLATRRTYTLKVLAVHDSTQIIIYCNGSTSYTYNYDEQDYTYVTLDSQQYCAVHSNKAIMVAQFSGYDGEDPSMGLVSGSKNFASKFQFSISGFHYATNSLYSLSFINIIVMAQYYQPDKIYLKIDGGKRSLNTEIWTPITVKGAVEAYATKIPVLLGVVEIIHANPAALMTTLVYGIDNRIGYIHPGGPLYNTAGRAAVFLSQPPLYHISLADTASITCSASEYDVSYQWVIESGSFPSKVIGIYNNTLVIPNVASSDEKTYTCKVTTQKGCVSSNTTKLITSGYPTITITPSNQSVEVTLTAIFTAVVTGVGPFTYQWQRGNKILKRETGSTYTVHNASQRDQNYYSCSVVNVYGDSAVSDRVWLQVTRNPPMITENPISKFIGLGSNFTNASSTCKAEGASGYSWERQSGSIPSDAIGANTNTLTLINLRLEDAGKYRCVATNNSGSTQSDYATLTIKAVSTNVVTHPVDATAAAPYSAVFTCSIYGYGYQNITWHREANKLPHNHQIKETSSPRIITTTLIIPNVTEQDVGKYYCQIWANNMRTQTDRANLHYAGLALKPTVEMTPGNSISLTVNDLRLSLRCYIPNGIDFKYRWEKKNEKNISRSQGINSRSLIITDLRPEDSGEYRCIASNSTGVISSDYTSPIVKVGLPVITRQPRSTTVQVFSAGSFTCTARSYGVVSLIWKRLNSKLPVTASISTSESSNEITSVLRLDSVGYYKGYYYCVAENSAGEINSTFVHFGIVVPCPEIVLHPIPIKVRPDSTVTFSCVAWSYGGLIYEWQKSGSLTLPNNSAVSYEKKPLEINAGVNTTVYEITIFNVQETDEGHYCCIASNGCGSTTECAWLEVDTSPRITRQPVSYTFRHNERNVQAFIISADGVGHIQYLWQKYDPYSNNWIPVSSRALNDTVPNLNFSVIMKEDQGIYYCIITNYDGNVTSDNVTLTVFGAPYITYYSVEMVTFEGNRVDLVCNATNDPDANIPVQVSWYNGTELIKPDGNHVMVNNKQNNITGQVHSVLSLNPVRYTDDGVYVCRAFNHPLSFAENRITLTVEYAPRVSIYPNGPNYKVNVDTKLFLYCIAKGLPTPMIQWYENNTLIPQQTAVLHEVLTNTPHVTLYSCEAKNNAGNIENTAYANVTVTVERNTCLPLSNPDNGQVHQFSDGTTAVFSCKNGFTTIGESVLHCINGNWSSKPPTCILS